METTRPKGRIRFFYSGKGDTIFIESKEADSKPQWALIDCCIPMHTQTHTSVRNFIKKNNIKKLKFVCLTHPDLDHYLGMKKLLRDCFHDIKNDRLEIEEFWDSGVNFMVFSALAERFRDKKRKRHIDELYRYVTKFIITRQIKYCIMNQGYQSISNLGSFYFIALAPTSNLVRRFEQKIVNEILEESDNNRLWAIGEKSNNLSILLVLMHTTLPISIIFGGDATKRVWEEALHAWPIMRKRLNKQKDVFDGVKISHHGAKDSLYPPLYERFCKPRKTIAILSAPPNDPSHPHEDVLKMLKQRGISVYATCWQTRLRPSVRTNLVFLGKPLKKTGDRSSMSLEYEWADIDVIIHSNGRLAVEPPESQIIKGDYDMTK